MSDSSPLDDFVDSVEGLEPADTGWADEYLADQAADLEKADAKPWE